MNIGDWAAALTLVLPWMLGGWLLSVANRNVAIVDVLWGPAIALAGLAWLLAVEPPSLRGQMAVGLAGLWALRLAMHVLVRGRGKPEDRRYREIRARNEPGFWWKSAFYVFALQALLACLVALPLYGATRSDNDLTLLDGIGVALFAAGFLFEAVADWQLLRFQRAGDAERGVMDRGLWRYSRHPNYFGESLLWWGLGLIAAAGGAWWTLAGPALLTFLLLRVSGVALTERDIATRRPDYQAYLRRTSAFLPRPPRN
ncbi:MAG: DUF1295 domain-containing protein [Gammaproteobacteria bacterium]|nr:DUF1295 domain-containing protein [Gammaproteobacteria bacterium]